MSVFVLDEPPTEPVPAVEIIEPFDPARLPPHPLRIEPSRWAPVRAWIAETAQIALGATLGASAVVAALSWFTR